MQEFAVARAEHDKAKDAAKEHEHEMRAKQQEMEARATEFWTMAAAEAEVPTEDECDPRERSNTTAKQFHRRNHERLKLTPAPSRPKAKIPIRGSAGGKPQQKKCSRHAETIQ